MIIFLLMVGQSVPVETSGLSARHSPVWLSHILPPQLHSGEKRKDFWKKNLQNVQLAFPLPRLAKWLYLGLCMGSQTKTKDFLDWFFCQYVEKCGFCTAVELDQIKYKVGNRTRKPLLKWLVQSFPAGQKQRQRGQSCPAGPLCIAV